jgi:hypothetical protein
MFNKLLVNGIELPFAKSGYPCSTSSKSSVAEWSEMINISQAKSQLPNSWKRSGK